MTEERRLDAEEPAPADRRMAWIVAVVAMALTLVPFLWGFSLKGARPALGWFSWLGYNLDDACVYLSWTRQAADGGFFQRNLFTTDPQSGHMFSVFFLALGNICRLTGLSPLAIFHAWRLLLGVLFLRSVWWLLELLIVSSTGRRAAFLLICFSAGLGWAPGLWADSGINSPVDVWQPEAITFLSIYTNPLFLISLLLMVGIVGNLWLAEKEQSMRRAIVAGVYGMLLGNIHTYDVITLFTVWGAYLAIRTVAARRIDWNGISRTAVFGALTCISSGYMFYLVKTEAVFAKRVAVETLSPSFSLYLLGFGLLLPLALYGALGARKSNVHYREGVRFLVIWAVANVLVAYLPVPFQRKMLMGAHIPIAALAGVGLAGLLSRIGSPTGRKAATALVVSLLALTNVRFMMRDAANFGNNRAQTGIHRPYLYPGEVAALDWLRKNAPRGSAIQPLPWISVTPEGKSGFYDVSLACFAPGLTGLPVNAGHWGETPSFEKTMGRWSRFLRPDATIESRIETLRTTGVRYLIFSQKSEESMDSTTAGFLQDFRTTPPSCLRLIPEASGPEADVFEVTL